MGQIKVAVGHGESELHAPREARGQRGQPIPIHGIQFQRFGSVDLLRSEAGGELFGILMRVYRDTRRQLRGAMQAGSLGRADIDPNAQCAGEVAHGNCRLIRIGQPVGETDPFGVLQAVRRTRVSKCSSVSDG